MNIWASLGALWIIMRNQYYHLSRNLSGWSKHPALTAPYGLWSSRSTIEESYDTSSVYFYAKEFPDVETNSSEAVRCDSQLYAPANWQTADVKAEHAATTTLKK